MTGTEKLNRYIDFVQHNPSKTNKWIKLAVKRHLDDLEKSKSDDFPYEFVPELVDRFCKFAETFKLGQEFHGVNLELLPWQAFVLGSTFGWVRKDDHNVRKFKKINILVSRKSGKTSLISTVALWDCLSGYGNECYCGATKLTQARRVWESARDMLYQNDALQKRLRVTESTSRIWCAKNGSYIQALASDSKKLDGLNASTVILDETASMQNAEILRVLQSSQGARKSPLLFMISSASSDIYSLGAMEFEHSKKVLEGSVIEDTYGAFLYCLEPEDDWTDPNQWIKAQPSLGVTVKESFLLEQCQEAKNNPIMREEFITKHCARFQKESTVAFIPTAKYREKVFENPHRLDKSKPWKAVMGIDLSKVNDLTSVVVDAFQEGYHHLYMRTFFPKGMIQQKLKGENINWGVWMGDKGLVEATEGDCIDYNYVLEAIISMCEEFHVEEIAFDPWNTNYVTSELDKKGYTLIPIQQGFKMLSPMLKDFQTQALDGKVSCDNEVLMWMNSNAECKTDNNGNLLLIKQDNNNRNRQGLRIDGVVSATMAIGRLCQLIQSGEVDLRSEAEIEADMKALFSSLKW